MPGLVEHGVEIVDPAFFVEGNERGPMGLVAYRVNDLVLQNAGQPGLE